MCLFVNVCVYFAFDVFTGKTLRKPTGKIHFYCLRVRNRSFVGLRMRICYQNNGGSNISKHENVKLWSDLFRNCAPVSLGGATDSDKVSFYLLIHVKFT